MLVLTRKIGETIVVDGRAVITLVEMRAGSVRIGVEAPPETLILRGELREKQKEVVA